ncbi:DUF3999 family protein [Pedobacter sp.]|uniref:DUF3999 family protein n=1 Tax=Pedobacter sp. TaxID=1411316 RepID=UPI002D1F9ECA|nr:DUF3999 family protein [Pedobacter sp.]
MMLKLKINVFLLCMMLVLGLSAQTDRYKYKRAISGVTSTWHTVQLPDQLLKNIQPGFRDIRIFGISGKDTLEIPYILKQRADKISSTKIDFKQLNQTVNENGYYFTFQSPAVNTINQISLSFKQANFDWKANLEGSNDNKEWFKILNDYRILSIKNNDTDYEFTRLNFPDAKFQYFRVLLKSPVPPVLVSAKIAKTDTVKGVYKNISHRPFRITKDVVTKASIIDVTLDGLVPVSYLKINAQSDFDFYRAVKIEYATDSFKTDKGIQYNYSDLYEGTITSLEKPEFSFNNTIASRLRITIQNNDNKPLRISLLELKGNIYELIARFDDQKYVYALYYGNPDVPAPSYDIEKFEQKIPGDLSAVAVGEQQNNPAYTVRTETPLFENKAWLWGLMAVIIVLLGWFSFKMLKNSAGS